MNKDFLKLYRALIRVKPEKSDAVVWLQGDRYDRGGVVVKIYKSKLANLIVISGNDILIGPHSRLGENNISLANMEKYLIRNGVAKRDIITDDGSLNTKEQATHIIKLAKKRKWNKLILVSSAYHQPRVLLSYIAASKLIGYKVKIINQSFLVGKNKTASGRALDNDELMKEESSKINKYQSTGDITSYKEGFDYLEGSKTPKLKFRPATIADADILFKWRNDPETRKWSHNSGRISKKEHNEWFSASLKNSNRKIFVVEYKKHPVGIIRTDGKEGVTELSWTVAPIARGHGIGKKMVSVFTKQITGLIMAEVKSHNEASKHIAEYAGMKIDHEENGILYYKRLLVDNRKINKLNIL